MERHKRTYTHLETNIDTYTQAHTYTFTCADFKVNGVLYV